MPYLKALVLGVVLVGYVLLIEVYSCVVARQFGSLHGNQG
jgi:hypothetical protein